MPTVNDHFINKDPSVRALYGQLLKILNKFGPVKEAPVSKNMNRFQSAASITRFASSHRRISMPNSKPG
jgi:hypothetical protein